jgi:hypothetical protein
MLLILNDALQSFVEEICNLPSIRELLYVCVGPFSFVRCVRTYLSTDRAEVGISVERTAIQEMMQARQRWLG